MNDGERRGGSFYDEPGVLDDYLAHRHRAVRSPNLVMEQPAFLRAAGDLGRARILDLGCGDGAFGRLAADQGCSHYLGVDGSAGMVERARHDLADLVDGGAFRIVHADLEDLETLTEVRSNGPYDLIASRMALHYVADLVAVLRPARELLAPGGRLVASVVHPVITSTVDPGPDRARTTWTVDDYFRPGPRRRRWFGSEVTWYHRTIEDYTVAVAAADLRLTALGEAAPDPDRFDGDQDEYERRARVPLFLILSAAGPAPRASTPPTDVRR